VFDPNKTDLNTNPSLCPVIQEAQKVLEISNDLGKAMRRLRIKLNQCDHCENGGTCPAIQSFQANIKAALSEIAEEWNLTP